MSDIIKLVSNDGYPSLTFTLKDANLGDPNDPDTWPIIDVSTGTVYLIFRAQNSTTVIDTMTCVYVTDGTDGQVLMVWNAAALSGLADGMYEGEIYIDYSGRTQTIYDKLKFQLRT